jgi:putative peptidoglycan lipid II flippase
MAPLVYSASIILGGLVGANHAGMGAEGFAWGVLAGSILGPFGLPLFGCLRTRMQWSPILSFRNPDLRRYLWLSFPIMIGFSIVIVDEWIIKNQASYLAAGDLSFLQYGRTLMKVPYDCSRQRSAGIWRAGSCSAANAGRNIRGTGVPDPSWF